MTIDCSYKNKNEPGWYRSAADNADEQVCYFNKPNDNEYYNVFLSKRIKAENFSEGIYLKIKRVRGKTEKENSDAKKTLQDGASNDRLSNIFLNFKVRADWSRSSKKTWRLYRAPLQKR